MKPSLFCCSWCAAARVVYYCLPVFAKSVGTVLWELAAPPKSIAGAVLCLLPQGVCHADANSKRNNKSGQQPHQAAATAVETLLALWCSLGLRVAVLAHGRRRRRACDSGR